MLYDLSPLGFIKIHGIDSKKFLQGQLTVNMESITHDQNFLCAHCNASGRVISLFYIFIFHDNYYLLLPRTMIKTTISALEKYVIFFKTKLMDASDEMWAVGSQDENIKLISNEYVTISIPLNSSRTIIAGMHNDIQPLLNPPLKSFNDWHLLDIESNIPHIYPETCLKFLPHDLNLDQLNALDFNKGCYTGQEIIARMHYRGKLKNRMKSISINSTEMPVLASDIHFIQNDKTHTGIIVDVAQEGYNSYKLLIVTNDIS